MENNGPMRRKSTIPVTDPQQSSPENETLPEENVSSRISDNEETGGPTECAVLPAASFLNADQHQPPIELPG